jgi:hypothetical protein
VVGDRVVVPVVGYLVKGENVKSLKTKMKGEIVIGSMVFLALASAFGYTAVKSDSMKKAQVEQTQKVAQ